MDISNVRSSDVMEIIVNSFKEAQGLKESKETDVSNELIGSISRRLEERFKDKENYVVFSKEKDNDEFKTKDFLYDIHLCKKAYVESPLNKSSVPYIKESLAIIQSQFGNDDRKCVVDFSKLLVGKAPLKIMILPKGNDVKEYLSPLKAMSENINEKLYCVFFPTPRDWDKCVEYEIYEMYKDRWERVI